jgi:hypothetical protein
VKFPQKAAPISLPGLIPGGFNPLSGHLLQLLVIISSGGFPMRKSIAIPTKSLPRPAFGGGCCPPTVRIHLQKSAKGK